MDGQLELYKTEEELNLKPSTEDEAKGNLHKVGSGGQS